MSESTPPNLPGDGIPSPQSAGQTPTPAPGGYPATMTVNLPEKIARWRVIGNMILAIPHFIIVYALIIVAEILAIVAWILGVFTGKIPAGILTFFAMVVRYQTRVGVYSSFLTEDYPPFGFSATFADPGDYSAVRVDFAAETEGRSRVSIFFRIILAIPHMIVLYVVSIIAFFVYIIGWFAVLFTGSWPTGLRNFIVGLMRWSTRLSAYLFLLTDDYPPFGFSE
ncbi:DUF4389 domain-containing protein [Aeromicrobium sp. P5_D10]